MSSERCYHYQLFINNRAFSCFGQSTKMSSLKSFKADPYQESETDYKRKTITFFVDNNALYPDPTEDTSWQVYVLSNATFGHWSLMFESETTGNAFTIELYKIIPKDKDNYQVVMHFVVMDIKKLALLKQSPLGKIKATGYHIFDRAYAVLRDMGGYQAFNNNCQTYCKLLAKDLGAPVDAETATDKVISGVSTLAEVGVIAGVAAILFKIIKNM